MPYENCGRDCLHCPYPVFPRGCAALPLTDWERQVLQDAHRDSYTGPIKDGRRVYKYSRSQACIRAVREERGISQKRLAAELGVSKALISFWETGRVAANWGKLCAVLPELEQHRPKEGNT